MDVVGAILLVIGLFRAPMPLYLGWQRTPEDAAEDRAYGTVGGLYLVVGFVMQALPSFGASWSGCSGWKAFAAVVTLGAGGLLAVVLWGVAYIVFLRRADAWARRKWPDLEGGELRRVGGLRFWRFERVRESA
ncbi:MAG: hypothetical protein QOH58_2607 [Thermoleophilaceae bacterium]|nr:hypothetical protein [Thermoleophilaceae bacterium]